MSNSAAIGILDSGLGGLSVLNEVRAYLPEESIIYVGDSAFCPYGNKAAEIIVSRTRAIAEWLIEKEIKLLVIACNSATIAAVEALRSEFLIPIVGMEPGVKPGCSVTQSGVVGILATEASLAGEKFLRLLDDHANGRIKVITQPCPRFVECVEAGELKGSVAELAVREAIEPILSAGADTLVLGCTHYPFLKPIIQQIAGDGIRIIDTGPAVAKQVAKIMNHYSLLAAGNVAPSFKLFSSGNTVTMSDLLPSLCPGLTAEIKPLPILSA